MNVALGVFALPNQLSWVRFLWLRIKIKPQNFFTAKLLFYVCLLPAHSGKRKPRKTWLNMLNRKVLIFPNLIMFSKTEFFWTTGGRHPLLHFAKSSSLVRPWAGKWTGLFHLKDHLPACLPNYQHCRPFCVLSHAAKNWIRTFWRKEVEGSSIVSQVIKNSR